MELTTRLIIGLSLMSLSHSILAQRQIHYPKPVPDSQALKFLPGVVSVEGIDFNSTFSPDGKSFYFSRSSKGKWEILVSKYENNQWSEPIRAPFSEENYSQADPMFSPDGKLYFISNKPLANEAVNNNFDIWYVEPSTNDGWSAPINLAEVNSDSSEYYISFSANGNLYFGSSRPGGYGGEDIYVSRLVNGKYTAPKNLGPQINSSQSEHDPAVSPDEHTIIFKSENRADGFGQADLYFSTFDSRSGWNRAHNLGPEINTDSYEYCPYFSPEGKYFFFSSQHDVMWIDMQVISKIIGTRGK
ncbi:MAG TPA: hypothetical protein VGD40_24145 [Chryseosolibacter sp.]